MSFGDVFKAVAPTIATVLGSPLAGAAIAFLGDKLGISEPTQEKIQQTISGMTGEQLVKMKELDYEFQKYMADLGIRLDTLQIGVNLEEAKSESVFVSGGRPACIWIGAFGLGYVAVVEPVLRFVAQVIFSYTGDFPPIDTTITMQVLFGLLGLGAMRSFDKAKEKKN